MGLQYFLSYISKLPECSKIVNILDELRKFKSENNRDPIILINLYTLSFHYRSDFKDKLIGLRLNQIQAEFGCFLKNLRDNGAELMFVFKRSQGSDSDYKAGCEIFDVISRLKTTEAVVQHFKDRIEAERNSWRRLDYKFEAPRTYQTLIMVLAQTAQKYGKFHAMETWDGKPSTVQPTKLSAAQARFANKHQVMASIGTDACKVFYEGAWKFWTDNTLDMETMTIREYNKEKILQDMGITFAQAPLYEALARGLYSTQENSENIFRYFNATKNDFFRKVASFVNRRKFQYPITDQALGSIVEEIFGQRDPQIIADFRRTIERMDPTIEKELESVFSHKVKEASDNDFLNYANQILTNKTIFITSTFTDLRVNDMQIPIALVSPWIQKTAGILLANLTDKEPRTLRTMLHHNSLPEEVKIDIVSPEFDVPKLDDLVSGLFPEAKAIEIMKWICGLTISDADFEDIPQEELCVYIILSHLMKNDSLTTFEAKAILQTVEDVKDDKVDSFNDPDTIDSRALRVSFLFSKLFFVLNSCFGSVGLKPYRCDYMFDNLHFQKIYEAEKNGKGGTDKSVERQVASLQCFMSV